MFLSAAVLISSHIKYLINLKSTNKYCKLKTKINLPTNLNQINLTDILNSFQFPNINPDTTVINETSQPSLIVTKYHMLCNMPKPGSLLPFDICQKSKFK